MQKKYYRILKNAAVLSCIVCALSGCGNRTESMERREERDPLLKRAQARKSANDLDGAIEMFNQALDRKPGLARAHLELGLLYDQKEDYIRAVYHYQRYLELRPKAEKRKLIEDLIRHARISFAATLPDQPSGAVAEIAILKKEIQSLKEQLATHPKSGAAVQSGSASISSGSGTSGRVGVPVPKPEPAQPPVQTYTVQSGDTLSSIASKFYSDSSKWKLIYDANRGTLGRPENVRAGQTLIIPR